MTVELRSDTFTMPTPGMLEVMFTARVGDDVFGEDETINTLQEKCAALFGMEAGLFCPSGTMTNQIAIKCHTQPGDEVICDEFSHVYQYEGGGIAFNSGCSVKLLQGNHGRITAAQVADSMHNPYDPHKPLSKLVSLENTCNRAGGSCYEFSEIEKIRKLCTEKQLGLHLDGARLFNALVAKKETPLQYGKVFDSISICLSKGLGTPVGSVLLGKKDFIHKAKRIRKVFGGGMRQAGYLAAAGIYALDHNIDRLQIDHDHAQQVAQVLRQKDWVQEILPVETNILIFSVKGKYTAPSLIAALADHDVKLIAMSAIHIRMVFHLGVTGEMVEKLITILNRL